MVNTSISKALTPEELDCRRPVWIALSELFLDTDVSLSYDYIVRECSESKYSMVALKDILDKEVAPVLLFNLMSVAGEWAGFDEEWLVERIIKRLRRYSFVPECMAKYVRNLGFREYLGEHWRVLAPRIEAAREV